MAQKTKVVATSMMMQASQIYFVKISESEDKCEHIAPAYS